MNFQQQLNKFDELMKSAANDADLSSLFKSPPRGKIRERFKIYAEGFDIRSKEALEESYQKLPDFFPKHDWLSLGYKYVRKYPSTSHNLHDLIEKFPEFLKEAGVNSDLVEFARLERSIAHSFNAFDEKPKISLERIAEITEESHFKFQASVELFESNWNVASRWLGKTKTLIEQKEYSLIYRVNDTALIRILDEKEFVVLRRLKSGQTLSHALLDVSLTPELLTKWLSSWISQNIIWDL